MVLKASAAPIRINIKSLRSIVRTADDENIFFTCLADFCHIVSFLAKHDYSSTNSVYLSLGFMLAIL
jgi:hypothetical protein